MELRYRTSLEKWKGLEKIALEQFGDKQLAKLCRGVARWIKLRGDVELEREICREITTPLDFAEAVYSSSKFPCPHCVNYEDCQSCPLYEEHHTCCVAWEKVDCYVTQWRMGE